MMSLKLFQALHFSKEEAVRTGCLSVSTDHLLLGILRSRDEVFVSLMEKLGVDVESLKDYIDSKLTGKESVAFKEPDSLSIGEQAQNVLRMSFYESSSHRHLEVTTSDLLISILKDGESAGAAFLREKMVTPSKVASIMDKITAKPVSYTPAARRELLN